MGGGGGMGDIFDLLGGRGGLASNKEALRRVSLSSTHSRLLLKKFTAASKQRSLLTASAFALSAKAVEAKKVQYRSVALVKDAEWSPRWCNSDLECTLSQMDLVTTAVVKEKSLTRRTSVRHAMERKCAKRRRLLRPKSIKVLPMASTILSTERPTNSPELSLAMSS